MALGEVRQGALDSLLQEAVAAAAGLPVAAVRRAAMLSGSTIPVVALALREGLAALEWIGLAVGSPILPMLASSAPDVAAAMARSGSADAVAVDAKLDGIRIQVHRSGEQVRIFTRSLEEITARLPEVGRPPAGPARHRPRAGRGGPARRRRRASPGFPGDRVARSPPPAASCT